MKRLLLWGLIEAKLLGLTEDYAKSAHQPASGPAEASSDPCRDNPARQQSPREIMPEN